MEIRKHVGADVGLDVELDYGLDVGLDVGSVSELGQMLGWIMG